MPRFLEGSQAWHCFRRWVGGCCCGRTGAARGFCSRSPTLALVLGRVAEALLPQLGPVIVTAYSLLSDLFTRRLARRVESPGLGGTQTWTTDSTVSAQLGQTGRRLSLRHGGTMTKLISRECKALVSGPCRRAAPPSYFFKVAGGPGPQATARLAGPESPRAARKSSGDRLRSSGRQPAIVRGSLVGAAGRQTQSASSSNRGLFGPASVTRLPQ
jgi:hypothetical protein